MVDIEKGASTKVTNFTFYLYSKWFVGCVLFLFFVFFFFFGDGSFASCLFFVLFFFFLVGWFFGVGNFNC